MTFNNQIQKSSVQGFITLYELDARKLGGEIYRFHGHNDGIITWQGKNFHPIAITAEGLEVRSDGRASAPSLTLHNDIGGVAGALRVLCLRFADFAGARLKVIHTLAEYLDSTDEQNYKIQHWYIEQKTAETNATTTFELSNPVDFEGLTIPVRQITGYCHWAVCGRYRGEECGYTGTAMFIDGKPTDDPAKDSCTGSLHECRLRDNVGSFGGFPASGLV
ncbi:lambda-like phage minor tail protein L [Moraxella cuniculi DSM 21768]|uniref:Lambda-like phage minor tail protein L n=1 Tax=Moraxella cuniculi DSM 21768 TaxID=1122245 RepID=A0A1N7G3X2_9GAMM|nr:phage minor tail protein L [Moraxella cuniculi]OOS03278.1 phage minor tail protein L [Moraxella cuniculi]SIS07262.1 lambda-like phage minor tail protein L [Moraxella cuniculi DSM 21768]